MAHAMLVLLAWHPDLIVPMLTLHVAAVGIWKDPELVRKIGEATALEVRATGMHWTFAPCVAVCRDSRWGRCYESYSEDPQIVRSFTTIVAGLQGQPPADHPHGYPFLHSVRLNFRVFHWIAPLVPATLFGIGTVSSSPSSAPCLLSPVALMILVAFEPWLWCGSMAIVAWLSG
ncbi:Lysosomal beta glucosidase [Hordeum vulgare]|nr:Lysosomal beta glucosidase [Hordeum vulgare]